MAILILDASVLINFLRVDRVDLLHRHTREIYVTEHVAAEVTAHYPEQIARLKAAETAQKVRQIVATDLAEVSLIADIRAVTRGRLGLGECSAIALAVARGWMLAIDDAAAIKHVRTQYPSLPLVTTRDIMVELIRAGRLTIARADAIKEEWQRDHRFKLPFASFADVL